MSEDKSNGKVTVIVYPGFTYKESIIYGSDAAKMLDSVLNIKAVVPEFSIMERTFLSVYEFGLHDKMQAQAAREAEAFFDCVKGFCKTRAIDAVFDKCVGAIEDVIEEIKAEEPDVNTIIIVPMPTSDVTHVAYHDEKDYRIEKTDNSSLESCNVVLVIS
ncbi:hypothetical protein [Candidatus Magnetominusculus dajiuhuensis]|uniref:hypothetical protein n=1 Tax=Candidatus Magnetominusculus dajiuhuensis TaxID=3137712 RepID=UPI003B4352E7